MPLLMIMTTAACLRLSWSRIDELLQKYWIDGYGDTPVVIMKTTNANGDGYTYKKEAFVQSFVFASGNCIQDDGSGTLYYIGDGTGC